MKIQFAYITPENAQYGKLCALVVEDEPAADGSFKSLEVLDGKVVVVTNPKTDWSNPKDLTPFLEIPKDLAPELFAALKNAFNENKT